MPVWRKAAATVIAKAWHASQPPIAANHSLHCTGVALPVVRMAYRSLFILQEEALRMLRMRPSSCPFPSQPAGRTLFGRATITGHMVDTRFIWAYERSDLCHHAGMLARDDDSCPVTALNLHSSAPMLSC